MPVYLVSFAFGSDHLVIFFFHRRVYQAQIDLNAEFILTSEMPLFKIVFFHMIFSMSCRQTFEIPLRVLQTLTVDISRVPR